MKKQEKIELTVLNGGNFISFADIPQTESDIQINCLRFWFLSDSQEDIEKEALETAWEIYWRNIWEKKRFSLKQAKELFNFYYL